MINSINDYLVSLKAELAGQDPATVQDALSDAAEYLGIALETAKKTRPALSEAEALGGIIKNYGTPAEVATAYRVAPVKIEPARAAPVKRNNPVARFFGILGQGRAWTSLLYMLLALGTGIVYFTWVVTGISLSAGLAVLIIGVPFFALFVLSVRGIAWLEGRIVEGLLGERMPRRARFSDNRKGLWPPFQGDVHRQVHLVLHDLHVSHAAVGRYLLHSCRHIALGFGRIYRPTCRTGSRMVADKHQRFFRLRLEPLHAEPLAASHHVRRRGGALLQYIPPRETGRQMAGGAG